MPPDPLISPQSLCAVPTAAASIAVFGDVMLDRYLVGSVERISPEAPVPVLHVASSFERPGGAANVAANIRSLGAVPRLVGVVGADVSAAQLAAVLAECDVATEWLRSTASASTTTKTRLLCGHQQIARFDVEDPPAAESLGHCKHFVETALVGSAAAVISDYAKGLCDRELCQSVIATARSRSIPVIVDPKGVDFSKYAGATVITPNRGEAVQASGLAIGSPEEGIRAGRELQREYGFEWVVVTLGEQGMVLVSESEAFHLPTRARTVFDVTGAGDTVVAALAAALARGMQMADACRFANLAAGIQVGRVGTARVYLHEVLAAEDEEATRALGKVLSREQLLAAVRHARGEGRSIGFTNGCFDILHHGHVALLAAAARECDVLVVAVNSDASVTRLKGTPRPFVPAVYRKAVLAAMESVAFVVEFEEDTPRDLIAALVPDVLVKGGDYSVADVVGADLVIAAGGRVVTPLFVPDVSTTNIVSRILSSARPEAVNP
ncbi:MAG: D-glycero-beta-D-manno-heptose-7-phosphate kinase [Planctomycetes bacterium]|nr:D-glycero-beta-D-manno-heptose-7-phosphate kinase [Planctomycetota bacterium]